MPLYELIVMAKCGPAKSTANLARNVSTSIFQAGGNVREVKILGDRYEHRHMQSYHKTTSMQRYKSIWSGEISADTVRREHRMQRAGN